MPAFFFNNEEYIHGIVMANYTSGAPVRGNLTLKAIIRPIQSIQRRYENKDQNRRRYQNPNEPNYSDYNEYDTDYNRPVIEKYFNFVSFTYLKKLLLVCCHVVIEIFILFFIYRMRNIRFGLKYHSIIMNLFLI